MNASIKPVSPGPHFSAVIPTFNRGKLALRAVESVFMQTYQPCEVIVVDDGSADDTRELIASYPGDVTYIYQDNNGSAVARNKGIKAAKSDWVALLDSDDIWVEDYLSRMAVAIQATAGSANYYFADTIQPPEKGGGSLWQAIKFSIDGRYEFRQDGSEWAMKSMQPMMLQSTVFKREAFLAVGCFLKELRYRDDTHMFLRLGIEQPLCAVSGFGAKMFGDDAPENRLTLTYDRSLRGFQMQTIMNEDLLRTMPDIQPAKKEIIQSRLAAAHWSLARAAWLDRDYAEFVKHLGFTAGKGSSREFAGRLWHLASRSAVLPKKPQDL